MQLLTPTPWDGVRYDAYTFQLAMAHLKSTRARLMYIAFDETDDWAHDGRYDRVLDAYARTDGFLEAAVDLDPVRSRTTRIGLTC